MSSNIVAAKQSSVLMLKQGFQTFGLHNLRLKKQ
jgi:hypothetical protein